MYRQSKESNDKTLKREREEKRRIRKNYVGLLRILNTVILKKILRFNASSFLNKKQLKNIKFREIFLCVFCIL